MCILIKKFDDNKKMLSTWWTFSVKSKFYYLSCRNCSKFQVFWWFLFKIAGFSSLCFKISQILGFSRFCGNPIMWNLAIKINSLSLKHQTQFVKLYLECFELPSYKWIIEGIGVSGDKTSSPVNFQSHLGQIVLGQWWKVL